jgi:hypothetical protein
MIDREQTGYVFALGPADPEAKQGFVQMSVQQCPECHALVVEDYLVEHRRWHADERTEPRA